ncbi:MAG TPA: nucleotidyltransferase domain-containing protein [Pyrinomonadaceae bacterium]|nr:nucleotidyltransferase domain-containing protein [Pyrinomonadaceae bacterium]
MTLAGNQFSAFIDDLKSSHGRNLAAVILYGSAATGEFVPDASDYNILIALHEIRPKDLRAAQAPMREWQRMGHSLPVYFTVGELKNAADVFPIEFHQMEKARKVLYGTDVLQNLEISDEYLRHQTEYELRSKLIQLRRLYIPASMSAENLVLLMIESLANFATLFRAVLLLHGVEPPLRKREVIAATIRHLKINAEPFEKIIALRGEKNASNSLNEISANELFSAYMSEIESVIEAVDKVNKS